MDYNRAIRTWKIVDSTPLHYDIQPREVPNKAALTHTKRIKKDDMCNGTRKAEYYWSKSQLIDIETKRLHRLITDHEDSIKRCHAALMEMAALNDSLPHYER